MPKSDLENLFNLPMTRKEFLGVSGLIVASLFGITSVIKELRAHAGTTNVAVEPETGATSGASRVTDTTASSGRAIKFGQVTTAPKQLRRLSHPFWSTVLSASTPLAATSSNYVARLTYQAKMGQTSTPVASPFGPPYNTDVSTGNYSLCVYVVPENTPRVPVWSGADKTGLRAVLDRGVPIPNPALIPDGNISPGGTDGAIIIICGTELWELWKFLPASASDPAGYAWRCNQGGYMANYHTHPGWWSGSRFFGGGTGVRKAGYDWGVSACGQSYLGGILTGEDWYADAIKHPLPLSLPITGYTYDKSIPTCLLPATRFDKHNFTRATDSIADPYRLPEGAWFRLPHSFDIDTWVTAHAKAVAGRAGSTAPTLRKVLVCLRDYGLFIAESGGIVGFSAEHSKIYGTPYHPYTAAQKPNWGNFGQQLPWDALVQIQPPAVDISVPTGG